MPQLIFKGVKRNDVMKLSEVLPNLLSEISETPIDYFTFERPNSEFFFGGKEVEMYPLIEIILFDRGLDVENKIANIVKSEVKKLNYEECEVYFTHIEIENYYE